MSENSRIVSENSRIVSKNSRIVSENVPKNASQNASINVVKIESKNSRMYEDRALTFLLQSCLFLSWKCWEMYHR